jgi:hypothetical protein
MQLFKLEGKMRRHMFLTVGTLSLVFVYSLANPRNVQQPVVSTREATVEVAAQMDIAPTDCGPTPEPVVVSEHFAPVLGTWPIWGTISSGTADRKGILSIPVENNNSGLLAGWWAHKVLWLVKTNYDGEVHITGFNIADDSPMYFSLEGNTPTIIAVLNPETPGAYAAGSDQFANFPSFVWVSKAGCYLIEARWNGGLWRQTIAVGLVRESLTWFTIDQSRPAE